MARPNYQGCPEPSRQKKSKVARRARAAETEPCGHARPSDGVPMAMRRSTQMLILGLAIFVIGAGVVFVSLSGSGGGSKNKSATATTSTTVQAGTVVVNAAAPSAPPTSFTIPEGKQAVAVQVPFVAGLAGYAKAGDTVNVYGNIDEKGVVDPAPPA